MIDEAGGGVVRLRVGRVEGGRWAEGWLRQGGELPYAYVSGSHVAPDPQEARMTLEASVERITGDAYVSGDRGQIWIVFDVPLQRVDWTCRSGVAPWSDGDGQGRGVVSAGPRSPTRARSARAHETPRARLVS